MQQTLIDAIGVPCAPAATSTAFVVASDASAAAQAAMRAAGALARSGEGVCVVSVLAPLPAIAPGIGVMSSELSVPIDPNIDAARCEERSQALRAQLQSIRGSRDWRLQIEIGSTARAVADAARTCGAKLVIVGLTRHSRLDRMLGRETALHIARESPVPVLALPAEMAAPPRRILICVDFTPASLFAARAALALAADDAVIELMHVRESPEPEIDVLAEWYASYQRALPTIFALLESRIEPQRDMRLQRRMVDGDIVTTLLERANEWDADLIVAASHGGGLLKRFAVGSVTTQLMRSITRPLLVVPAMSRAAQ